MDNQEKLRISSSNPYHNLTKYCYLAEALQYLTFTRPDITYVVQQVCLFMHGSRMQHMSASKRIIHYIKGILSLVFTSILLRLVSLSPILTQTGVDAQTLDDRLLVTVHISKVT